MPGISSTPTARLRWRCSSREALAGPGAVGFLAWGPADRELLRFDAGGRQIGRLAGAVGLEDMALE